MFNESAGEAAASQNFKLPAYNPNRLCHILLGDYAAIIEAINRMEVLKYCERIAWIEPIPTGRSGEYISVMSRRLPPAE